MYKYTPFKILKKNLLKKQKGVETVEFAIIAPLLFVLLFGICEFGLALYNKAMLTNVSRVAAREGIVLRKPKLTQNQIEEKANDLLRKTPGDPQSPYILVNFKSGISPSITASPIPASPSQTPLTVSISYEYHTLVIGNLLKLISAGSFPGKWTINASSTMLHE